jgi:beta-galactosidase
MRPSASKNGCVLRSFSLVCLITIFSLIGNAMSPDVRKTENFGRNWRFHLQDISGAQEPKFDDTQWRLLNVPHDWSIEGEFSKDNPATPGGGALPGGIGWYRKSFETPTSDKGKLVYVKFDGVYRNSEVWINGHYLGKRPYGYSSFRYELTPFLKYGTDKNILAVRVDNSQQPNSRWYSGSGIYRNVWLVTTEKVAVDHWGTFVTTPEVTAQRAKVSIVTKVRNAASKKQSVQLKTVIFNKDNVEVGTTTSPFAIPADSSCEVAQEIEVKNPSLWSVDHPMLYTAFSTVVSGKKVVDEYETTFGIRSFDFNVDKGFLLNGEHVKVNGVCNHHDLGCLGAAVNARAIERQLEILKSMGVNGIRTSHNPPAPELLNLCDKMGFIVLDEAFDMWKKKKTDFDYALDWDQWHKRDIQDMVLRDRNHPSVFIWSIGNEVLEQWDTKDSSGIVIARELSSIVKSLDITRPITSACNSPIPENPVIRSGALDLVGYNYRHDKYPDFPKTFPGQKFLATETVSALATRGHYDMPSDSIRRWPKRWDLPFNEGNPDNTCSSYDNCSAPWGSTQEETWIIIKKYDFLSGQFIWTGFDYLGEPTPYGWPSRSSYFGIVDLAGFPKDAFYMYQSEWTDKPVLHVFPHWNWQKGDTVDVWAYTNCEQVELFLNGTSLVTKSKNRDELHIVWRVPFVSGTLRAVGRTGGKEVLTQEIKTSGTAATIDLQADRSVIAADGRDLSFVTVRILDKEGVLVPYADNPVRFEIEGGGKIVGVDNGLQTSLEPFKASERKAFSGICLVVVQSNEKPGKLKLEAKSDGLTGSSILIDTK